MKIKKSFDSFKFSLAGLGLASCVKGSKGAGSKVGSILSMKYPIYSMVKEVSGDLNDVLPMIQSGAGIHERNRQTVTQRPFMKQMSLCIILGLLESWAGSLILVYKVQQRS